LHVLSPSHKHTLLFPLFLCLVMTILVEDE